MPAVLVEKTGHVLTVSLNRPEKKNAVNCEVMCRLVDAWHQNLTVPISFYQLKGVLFTNVLSKAANGKLILYVALDQACEAIVYLRRFKNVDCSDPIVMRPSVESLGFKLWHARNLARGLRKLNPEQDQ